MFNKSLEIANALWEKDCKIRCQVFSMAFWKSRLLAVSKNNARTHPLNLRNPIYFNGIRYDDKGSCAELNLFIKLRNTTNIPFSKITIVNVRLDRNKRIAMSRPCISCSNLIKYLAPKNVYFTNEYGEFEIYGFEKT